MAIRKATKKAAAKNPPKKSAAASRKPLAKSKPAARKPAPKKAGKLRAAVNKAAGSLKKSVAKVARRVKPKDGRPPDWPALSPYMTVRNGQASLDFYARAFGFRSEHEPMRDANGEITHAGMRLGEACIMFAPQGMASEMRTPRDSGGIGLSLYVYVADVDRHYAQAVAAGAQVLQVPADQFWGDRIACYLDPDGYHWTFATHIGGFDASKAPH